MLNAKSTFHRNIQKANELGSLFDSLTTVVAMPVQFDDLLRSQIVQAVSAFDKLMHDLIRLGMVQIFKGTRTATPKYLSDTVPLSAVSALSAGALPPPEVAFAETIRTKHSILSFQDPDKIANGLAFIWNEKFKWTQIAEGLAMPEEQAKLKQKLIVSRRNAIVHEADLDPVTNQKIAISHAQAKDVADFQLALGNRICDLII